MQSDKRPSRPPSAPASGHRRNGGWRPFRNWQLRTKLVLITLALLAAICLAVGLSAHAAMTSFLTGQLDEQLAQASARANRSQEEFRRDRDDEDEENDGGAQDSENIADALVGPGTRAGTLNARIGDHGVRGAGIFTSDGGRQDLTEADEQILADLALDVPPVDRTLSVGEYRLVAHYNPRREYTIVTGLPLLAKEETLASLTRTMTVVSAAGLVAAALLGTLIIRRTLRPLEELSGVATRVSRLPLGEGEVAMAERVPAGIAVPATEVGRLGHAFNLMLDNVAGAFSARHRSETKLRQFVADASHELRTPLTAIRGFEAARILMAAPGVDAVGLTGITEAADLGAGTFHNYFQSRDEIVEAVAEASVESAGSALDQFARTMLCVVGVPAGEAEEIASRPLPRFQILPGSRLDIV